MTSKESAENLRLEDLELEIERGLRSFFYVGWALGVIRDNKLYKSSGYKNFNIYCQNRWAMTRRNADRLIKATEVVINLIELPTDDLSLIDSFKSESNWSHFLNEIDFPLPQNESQMRPLVGYEPEAQRTIWRLASSKTGGMPPPASIVKETAIEIMKKIEQTDPSQETLSQLEIGDIAILQAKDISTLKAYQGYWCVVKAKNNIIYDIDVYDRTLTLVKPEYLLKLECTEEEKQAAISLMARLQRIASVETISRSVNAILIEFGSRHDFLLPEMDRQILAFIENQLGITNN